MFGLGTLFYSCLFVVNAIAVLSEDRFLNRIGWGSSGAVATGFEFQQPGDTNVKSRLVNLISATRTLLRIPLIAINMVVIVYELVLG
ncbi:unnamed protein product [Kuraishia capsulata CBS 1993]|uniref:Yos1-like protein n=1 Tax=Kuraishia capsulata CBS 1993 TaxID=1382522 RepID=W6MRA7_9ASCO|nr:uncharacterized protein KUCA_T00005254001 [Kuraishia capsulata CBS 1993]CDK29266.1 unnamed protein product [Kuraishia capsulata CBS 1993]